MPKPKFIICAETVLDDKLAGRVSYINVLESVSISRRQDGTRVESESASVVDDRLRFVGVAGWQREDDDSRREGLECELGVTVGTGNYNQIMKAQFEFTKQFHRFIATIVVPFNESLQTGDIVFVSKLRDTATGEEWEQEYSVPIEVNI